MSSIFKKWKIHPYVRKPIFFALEKNVEAYQKSK